MASTQARARGRSRRIPRLAFARCLRPQESPRQSSPRTELPSSRRPPSGTRSRWSPRRTGQPLASLCLVPSVEVVASTSRRLRQVGQAPDARQSPPSSSASAARVIPVEPLAPSPRCALRRRGREVVIAVGPLVGGPGRSLLAERSSERNHLAAMRHSGRRSTARAREQDARVPPGPSGASSARSRMDRRRARGVGIVLRRLAAVEHAVVAHHANAAQPRAVRQCACAPRRLRRRPVAPGQQQDDVARASARRRTRPRRRAPARRARSPSHLATSSGPAPSPTRPAAWRRSGSPSCPRRSRSRPASARASAWPSGSRVSRVTWPTRR